MKLIPVYLMLLLFGVNDTNLTTLRKQYISAATSEESAGSFHKSFENISDTHQDATVLAYKAASIVLMAKYEGWILSKTKLFNKGKNLLETAIKKEPENYEARLIRFNIQDNVPWITGYTGNIKDDKTFLLKNFASQPADLKEFARAYIQQCDAFTDKEKLQVK